MAQHCVDGDQAFKGLQLCQSSMQLSLTAAVQQVAAVLVEAVAQPGASNKVVEIVSSKDASELPPDQWFSNI